MIPDIRPDEQTTEPYGRSGCLPCSNRKSFKKIALKRDPRKVCMFDQSRNSKFSRDFCANRKSFKKIMRKRDPWKVCLTYLGIANFAGTFAQTENPSIK